MNPIPLTTPGFEGDRVSPAAGGGARLRQARIALIAALLAGLGFVAATLGESALIAVIEPSERALEWISDLILATAFGVTTYLWLHLRATRAALQEAERARIVFDTQLVLAADIQKNLLPPPPPTQNGVSWAARLRPAFRVSGDYYDFVGTGPSTRLFLVADIAGKGIPAALSMAHVRALFRQATRETLEPRAIAVLLSQALFADTGGLPYLTCIVGRLDEQARTLTYTNAGHPEGLILHDRDIRRLGVGGPPAGLLPDAAYDQERCALAAGEIGVFVTDGVTERLEAGGLGLAAFLAEERPHEADEACERIMSLTDRSQHKPVEGWDDDRAVVAFAIH